MGVAARDLDRAVERRVGRVGARWRWLCRWRGPPDDSACPPERPRRADRRHPRGIRDVPARGVEPDHGSHRMDSEPRTRHVAARALATSALSIFGDHQDVMACRQTGWAMLASNSAQEVMDLAIIAHTATLEARVPFLHFFDGFRTSHEIQKIEEVSQDVMRQMINDDLVRAHRLRGLTPEKPMIRGTAQNPDVYFQAREAVNKYYLATPEIVQRVMDKYAALTGRAYHLFDYYGDPNAESVIILMGSGADTVEETVDYLNSQGKKYGLLKVRLYRPFNAEAFVKALGTGFRGVELKDLAVLRDELGRPFIKICNNLNRHLQGIDENKIHVSISNTDSLAIAMVVIETD